MAKKPEPSFDKQTLKDLKVAFKLYDTDRDGKITYKELGRVLKSFGNDYNQAELKEIMNNVDIDKNGTTNFEEFLQIMSDVLTKVTSQQDDVIAAFKVFDKNGVGKIKSSELRTVMMKLGEKLSREETDEMMREAGINGDGVIDYQEFVATTLNKSVDETNK